MKLTPLHDWAVIVPEAHERTAGGLFIPETAKEKPEEGVVEAIGPGALEEEKYGKKKDEQKERKFIPTVVKPGDRVLYERWAGQTYKIGAEDRILVRERNILGLIDRPLIPAATTHTSSTAVAERSVPVPQTMVEAPQASVVKPKAKKKATKPAAKKSARKPAGKAKKSAAKKPVKKAAKKAAKKSARPAVRGTKSKKAVKKK